MGRFYITTPIFYVNGDPHLGTAYAVILADAIARWHRLIGDEVRFVTGTDEHGLKIAQSAEAHGVSPQAWVDVTSAQFRRAWDALEVSYDDFIRTTEPRHHRSVQRFLERIHDRGDIYLGTYEGLYCVRCEAYYQPGELEPGELCPVHHVACERMREENYFFALSRYQDRLLEHYERHPEAIWPESRRNEVLRFIEGGLTDISITRTSIDWGVRVPWDSRHVFYVWYDALVNYLTAIGYAEDSAEVAAWWPAAHHLLGKDILRFHAVWWPAMCLAAGIDPPAQLIVTGWLLNEGEKMSKSLANQIDPLGVQRALSADALRHYLVRSSAIGPDWDVSLEALVALYNAELANGFGNLVARVGSLIVQRLGGHVPDAPATPPDELAIAETIEAVRAGWERWRPNDAMDAAIGLVHRLNAYLEATEPWRLAKGSAEAASVLGTAREGARLASVLLSPAIPDGAERARRALGFDEAGPLAWQPGMGGATITKPAPLFPRTDLDAVVGRR
ncbi:methionyl-tRNA synthetase [Acidimicrobium ferrooxidans DSM 10331]|uniref:Methionine--tRNA ligase n=1 Tax=Acidimicrobium ferrooxidans (strain DSM 10331 / JCM 15462 / NBRC 103882 / ICP) TaxID=525909 RepID=C7M396_ACIFD|nr:class I tRNA ligase family protein [Acidimicrobium ferrooxidans]ACU53490.1 methionyl-tRNA synthetase [Acidimicrobium ferrooxidans DSM 10331]